MARQDIRIGKIFGIEIGVSFSWFVIFGLVTVLLATAYFPQNYPKLPRYEYLALGLITALLFFASVLTHELMHSVVAKLNNIPIHSITLFIFGGVAHMDRDAEKPREEFLMAAAGPVTSLVLSLLFAMIYLASTAFHLPVLIAGPALYLAIINLYLALFNLVPGFPLDGGRVLRAVIWWATGDVRRATRIASRFGQAFAAFLIAVGILMVFSSQTLWLDGIWFIFIGLFLWQVAAAGYEEVVLHNVLNNVTVADIMTRDVIAADATIMLDALVNEYFMRYKHSRFPVEEDGHTIGVVTLDDVKDVPREKWPQTRTRAITPPLSDEEAVASTTPAEEALSRMMAAKRGHLIVIDDDVLVGIMTMNDLATAVRMRRGLGV